MKEASSTMVFITIFAIVFGAASTLLRGQVIDALIDAGVFEKMGEPRRNFFSDALFIRVLFVAGKGIRPVHRMLFRLYFVLTSVFLISALTGFVVAMGR